MMTVAVPHHLDLNTKPDHTTREQLGENSYSRDPPRSSRLDLSEAIEGELSSVGRSPFWDLGQAASDKLSEILDLLHTVQDKLSEPALSRRRIGSSVRR